MSNCEELYKIACYSCGNIVYGNKYCFKRCDDCYNISCVNSIKKCTYCDRQVCKECISNKYPNWEISGCVNVQTNYNNKFGFETLNYHCIYPIYSNDDNILLKYCGEKSLFGNICFHHLDYINDMIIDVLIMLPKELIAICAEYFFVKMIESNWNTTEMCEFRNKEIEKYKMNLLRSKEIEWKQLRQTLINHSLLI